MSTELLNSDDIGLNSPMCGVSSPWLPPIDSYSGYSYKWCHWLNHSLSLPEGWVLAETGRKQLAQPLHNTLHPSILTSFVILEMVEKQTWQLHVWWYHGVYNCKTIGRSSCRHTSMRYHQGSNNKWDRQEVCIYSIPEITVILQWQNKYQNTRTSAKGLKKRHLVPGPSHAAF